MSWKVLHDGPATAIEVHAFPSGKVGHVVTVIHDVVQYKAFYDGIYLGAHEAIEDARSAVELVDSVRAVQPLPLKHRAPIRLDDSDHQ